MAISIPTVRWQAIAAIIAIIVGIGLIYPLWKGVFTIREQVSETVGMSNEEAKAAYPLKLGQVENLRDIARQIGTEIEKEADETKRKLDNWQEKLLGAKEKGKKEFYQEKVKKLKVDSEVAIQAADLWKKHPGHFSWYSEASGYLASAESLSREKSYSKAVRALNKAEEPFNKLITWRTNTKSTLEQVVTIRQKIRNKTEPSLYVWPQKLLSRVSEKLLVEDGTGAATETQEASEALEKVDAVVAVRKKAKEKAADAKVSKGIVELRADYESVSSHMTKGDNLLKEGQLDEAKVQYEAAANKYGDLLAKATKNIDGLFAMGKSKFSAGSYEEAIIFFNQVLKIKPSHSEATKLIDNAKKKINITSLLAKAKANIDKEKWEVALKALEELHSLDPIQVEAKALNKKIPYYYKLAKIQTLRLGGGVKLEMVLIPAGEFLMGSPSTDEGRDDDEDQHRVKITKPFYLSKYEVTQAQWEAVMDDKPSHFSSCGSNCPVEKVSWEDCQNFIRKFNQREGTTKYRLPTEAEWEYACRAGGTTAYSFGNSESSLEYYAWYDNNSMNKTHPVRQKKPNAWGLYDMHGNVWEWVNDWYGSDYYEESSLENPKGPSSGSHRVFRGGGWYFYAGYCRSANRYSLSPDGRDVGLGLRLARTP